MKTTVLLLILFLCTDAFSDEPLRIATWNLEHLGSSGRGFGGGFGSEPLPFRSAKDLKAIAGIIELSGIDILCIQEVGITDSDDGEPRSAPLDVITQHLGPSWFYRIAKTESPTSTNAHGSMHNAFLWNSENVDALAVATFDLPNIKVGAADTFDRDPVVGYFAGVPDDGTDGNDFVLVNVHFASGQENDETHLVSMVMIERNLGSFLKSIGIRESDRIILGDFNNNPYKLDDGGEPEHSNILYDYMSEKGYVDLTTADVGFTRLNDALDSIIDHILVNSSARRHMDNLSVMRVLPEDTTETALSAWRRRYSDHLPLLFEIQVTSDDDSDTP